MSATHTQILASTVSLYDSSFVCVVDIYRPGQLQGKVLPCMPIKLILN